MTFFQRFFRSKCCWALLIFVALIVGLFVKVIIADFAQDGAENWYPYFIFTGSQECSLDRECRGKRGNYVGHRSFFGTSSYESTFSLNQFYFPVKETPDGEKFYVRIRAADWQCREVGSNFSKQPPIEPDRQDLRNGFVYACWPSKPLPFLE